MIDFLRLVDDALARQAMRPHEGQAYQKPAVDVIRHYTQRVRTSRVPLLGRALSIVAIVEHPGDLTLDTPGCRALIERVGTIMSARYSPLQALSLALTTLVVSETPVHPDDDATLAHALVDQPRLRTVPMGFFKINLADRTMAQAVRPGPDNLFVEGAQLADILAGTFRRLVPFLDF